MAGLVKIRNNTMRNLFIMNTIWLLKNKPPQIYDINN
jgi:hypothetical protein